MMRVPSTSSVASAQVLTLSAASQLSDIGISTTNKSVPAASSARTAILSTILPIDDAACQVSSAMSESKFIPNKVHMSKSVNQRPGEGTSDPRVTHSGALPGQVMSRDPVLDEKQILNEEEAKPSSLEALTRQSAQLLPKSRDPSSRFDQMGPSLIHLSPTRTLHKDHELFAPQPIKNVDTSSANGGFFVSKSQSSRRQVLHPPHKSDTQDMGTRKPEVRMSQQDFDNLECSRKDTLGLVNDRRSSREDVCATKATACSDRTFHSVDTGVSRHEQGGPSLIQFSPTRSTYKAHEIPNSLPTKDVDTDSASDGLFVSKSQSTRRQVLHAHHNSATQEMETSKPDVRASQQDFSNLEYPRNGTFNLVNDRLSSRHDVRATKPSAGSRGTLHSVDVYKSIRGDQASFDSADQQLMINAYKSKKEYGEISNFRCELPDHQVRISEQQRHTDMRNDNEHRQEIVPTAYPTIAMPDRVGSYVRSSIVSEQEHAPPIWRPQMPSDWVNGKPLYLTTGAMKYGVDTENAKDAEPLQATHELSREAANFLLSTPSSNVGVKSFEKLPDKNTLQSILTVQHAHGMNMPENWYLTNRLESEAPDPARLFSTESHAIERSRPVFDLEVKRSGIQEYNQMCAVPEAVGYQTRQFQGMDNGYTRDSAFYPVQLHSTDFLSQPNPENVNLEHSSYAWQYTSDTERRLRQSSNTTLNSAYFEQPRHQSANKPVGMAPLSLERLKLSRNNLEQNPQLLDKIDAQATSRVLIANDKDMTAPHFAAGSRSVREKGSVRGASSYSADVEHRRLGIENDVLSYVVTAETNVDGAPSGGRQVDNTDHLGSLTAQMNTYLTHATRESFDKLSVLDASKADQILGIKTDVVTSHATALVRAPVHISIETDTVSKGFLTPHQKSSKEVEQNLADSQGQLPDGVSHRHLNDALCNPDSNSSLATDKFSPDVDVASAVQHANQNFLKGHVLFTEQPASRVRSTKMPRVESASAHSTADEYGEIGLPWDWIEVKKVLNAYKRLRSRDSRQLSSETLFGVEQNPSVQEVTDVETEVPDSLAEDIVNTLVEMLNENVPLSELFGNRNPTLHSSPEVDFIDTDGGTPLPLEERLSLNSKEGTYFCLSEETNQNRTASFGSASKTIFGDYGTSSTETCENQRNITANDEEANEKHKKQKEGHAEDYNEDTETEQTEETEKVLCVLDSLYSKMWQPNNIATTRQSANSSALSAVHDTLRDRTSKSEIGGQIHLHDLGHLTEAADSGYSSAMMSKRQESGELDIAENEATTWRYQIRSAGGAEAWSHRNATRGATDAHSSSNSIEATLASRAVPAVSNTSAMVTRAAPLPLGLVDDGRAGADGLTAKSYDNHQERILYNAEPSKASSQEPSRKMQGALSPAAALGANCVLEQKVLPSSGRRGEHKAVQVRNSHAVNRTTTSVPLSFSKDALLIREKAAAVEPLEESPVSATLEAGTSLTREPRGTESAAASLSVATQPIADWPEAGPRHKMPRQRTMEDAAVGCRMLQSSAAKAQAVMAATPAENSKNSSKCSTGLTRSLADADSTVRSAMRSTKYRSTRSNLHECTVDADCCREGNRVRGRRVNIVLPTTAVHRMASSGSMIGESRGTHHEGLQGREPVRAVSEVSHASKSLQTEALSASSDIDSQFQTAADGPDRTVVSLSETEPEIDSYEQVSAHGGINDLTMSVESDNSGQVMSYDSTRDALRATAKRPSASDGPTPTSLVRHSWQSRRLSDDEQQTTAELMTRSNNSHQKLKRGALYGGGGGERGGCSGFGVRSTVPLLFLVGLPLLSAMILIVFWRSRPKPSTVELFFQDTLLELCSVVPLYHWCHA